MPSSRTSCRQQKRCLFFFFNDTATTEIYTLSLHDALPISSGPGRSPAEPRTHRAPGPASRDAAPRSEEHTSELQSHLNLVCRLLLEKKNISPPPIQPGANPQTILPELSFHACQSISPETPI